MPTCKALWRSACWGVIILSAVCAYAGPGDNGLRSNSVSSNGLSQNSVETSAGLKDSAAQAVTAPHAATPAAGSPRLIALADPNLASTAAKRQQLTYLVRCALPEDVTLYADHGTERFTFQGRMGLAPRWLSESMTPSGFAQKVSLEDAFCAQNRTF